MTGISVGGTAAGQTGGTFYVAAGSTITLTCSAAPTWSWAAPQPESAAGSSALVGNPAPPGGQLGTLPQMTFLKSTAVYADSASIPAGTPGSGAQQLYQALTNAGAGLLAYRDGTDNVGHAALSN